MSYDLCTTELQMKRADKLRLSLGDAFIRQFPKHRYLIVHARVTGKAIKAYAIGRRGIVERVNILESL